MHTEEQVVLFSTQFSDEISLFANVIIERVDFVVESCALLHVLLVFVGIEVAPLLGVGEGVSVLLL